MPAGIAVTVDDGSALVDFFGVDAAGRGEWIGKLLAAASDPGQVEKLTRVAAPARFVGRSASGEPVMDGGFSEPRPMFRVPVAVAGRAGLLDEVGSG